MVEGAHKLEVVRLRELVERTPARRERHVDMLRAVAIAAVVVGHWLVIVVYDEQGLGGFSALRELTWAHPLTWLFQVMPVFFLVGGFANAASLTAHRSRGGGAVGWLLGRSARLIPPTVMLLLVLAGVALAAGLLGADAELVGSAVWLASIPLWFLVVYLAVVFLTPPMHALHRRAGLAVPLVLVGLVAAGDVARLGFGATLLPYANFLFAWLAVHQVGFVWQDGRLPARPRVAVPLSLGGLVALLLLTVAGPYPVSMVNVPGEELQNTSPPTLALLALATTQLGVALLLRNPSERWLQRRGPWMAVVAVNAVILTIFLWHMSAVVLTVLGLHLTGLLPDQPVGSTAWLLWKVPWLALLSLVLAGLVLVFGRVEIRGAVRAAERSRYLPAAATEMLSRTSVRGGLTAAGLLVVVLGLLGIATAGPAHHGPFGLPTGALLAVLAGAAVLRLVRSVPEGRAAGG